MQQKESITALARLLQSTALLPTGRCHVSFSPWKIRPYDAACRQKIFWSVSFCQSHTPTEDIGNVS